MMRPASGDFSTRTCSLSPKVRREGIDGKGDGGFGFRRQRRGKRTTLMRRWPSRLQARYLIDLCAERLELAPLMPDAPLGADPSVALTSALREGADAGLEKLVGGNAEEPRDTVKIAYSDAPAFVQELVHPRFIMPTPFRKRFLFLPPGGEQAADIFPQNIERFEVIPVGHAARNR